MSDVWIPTIDADPSTIEVNPFHENGNGHQASPLTDPTCSLDEFVSRREEDRAEPLIVGPNGPILTPFALGLLAGKTSGGKTTYVVDLLLHAAAGLDYIGFTFPRPLRVLFIQNEGPRGDFQDKLEERLTSWPHDRTGFRVFDVPAWWGDVKLSSDEQRPVIRHAIERHETDLVVCDSLTRFGVKGNGSPEETRAFVDLLVATGLTRDVAFLLLHHPLTRPDPSLGELEQIAGAWNPHADVIAMLKKQDGNRARLTFPKPHRRMKGPPPRMILGFDPETEAFELVAYESDAEERDYPAELAKLLADGEWRSVNQLRQSRDKGGIGAREDAIQLALKDPRFETAKGEQIGKKGRSKTVDHYHLTNPHDPPVGHVGLQLAGAEK